MSLQAKNGVNVYNNKITNLADPTLPTDAVNRQFVDAIVRGLDWKSEVIAASPGTNVNIASPGTTLDGVTLTAGMQTIPDIGTVTRILLKDQTDTTQNGVYDWNGGTSALTRSGDSDTGPRLSGSTYTVQRGTVNADRVYRVNTDDSITVGTTGIAFAQVGAAAAPYTAGSGLILSGQQFSVNAGPGIIADATSTRVDPAVVARGYYGTCVATTDPQTFATMLGTDKLGVTIWEGATQVFPDVTRSTDGTGKVTVLWGSAPTAGQYNVAVVALAAS